MAVNKSKQITPQSKLRERLGDEYAGLVLSSGKSVYQALLDAVDDEIIDLDENGSILIPLNTSDSPWIYHKTPEDRRKEYYNCRYLTVVLFEIIYGKKQVPNGCEQCYKVKVVVNTVVELNELKGLLSQVPCNSKCGTEVGHQYSQNIYSAFFYVDGLDHAYDICETIEKLVHRNEVLKSSTKVTIKRGCTPFEIQVGRSDQWSFGNSNPDLEEKLYSLFSLSARKPVDDKLVFIKWIQTAYQIGDESYLKLTHGQRFYKETIDYKK